MNQLINALYDLGCFATEDLVAWNAQIEKAHMVAPFKVKPKTTQAILDLLSAIEEEYPKGD
jgi:hypothetical protein